MPRFRLALALMLTAACLAAPASAIPVPVEAQKTPIATIASAVDAQAEMPLLVTQVAERFIGAPYGSQGWNAREGLASELDAFDCVTLVEASLAIARAVAMGEPTRRAYARELERVRFRDGEKGGFASRLHYFTDWIRDNARRGLVRDITAELGGEPDTRDIHYMTANWEKYQKKKVASDFEAMHAVERSLSASRRHMLPKARVAAIADRLVSGDILAIATHIDGLDVVHVGMAYRKPDGVVHFLHAPVPGSKVQVSEKPLAAYLQVYDAHVGVIVARPLRPERGWWPSWLSW